MVSGSVKSSYRRAFLTDGMSQNFSTCDFAAWLKDILGNPVHKVVSAKNHITGCCTVGRQSHGIEPKSSVLDAGCRNEFNVSESPSDERVTYSTEGNDRKE